MLQNCPLEASWAHFPGWAQKCFKTVRPARLQCENNVEFLFFCCSGGCSGDDRAFAAKAMILMDECRVDICTVGNLAMAVFCLRFMM